MGAKTRIAWCHSTFNPWWGCKHVSPGCSHCYAEALARRMLPQSRLWQGEYRTFGPAHWKEPLKWHQRAVERQARERVFCASMADVFDPQAPAVEREKLWTLIKATPFFDWLLLTKRPEMFGALLPWVREPGEPWINVWLGVTAENQAMADRRIPVLLATPAAMRFVSCEPLLERVSLGPIVASNLDLVIAGAESGAKARPADLDWYRLLRDHCVEGGTPFFLKQHVVGGKKIEMPELDGVVWNEIPREADRLPGCACPEPCPGFKCISSKHRGPRTTPWCVGFDDVEQLEKLGRDARSGEGICCVCAAD